VTIYATGLGAVTRQGTLSVAVTPVLAVLAGVEMQPSFAGLTLDLLAFIKLICHSGNHSAGLDLPLLLRQGGVDGNTVSLSVQ